MSCKINQLEADVKMLLERLMNRTEIFLKRDVEQTLKINELKNKIKELKMSSSSVVEQCLDKA